MHIGKYVFSQIGFHLPSRVFDRCVDRYKGNRYVSISLAGTSYCA